MGIKEELNTGAVYIGTSGYSYSDWVGPFYPERFRSNEFLSFYASRFNLVELNFSYYRQPEAAQLIRMTESTDKSFQFSIKGHKTMTHEISRDWRKDVAKYRTGILPLLSKGRLAAVLLQFPFSFHYEPENRLYLRDLCGEMNDLPLVVEFRNRKWQTDRVYDGLRSRGIGIAVADYPKLKDLPIPTSVTTSEIGYVRFHGRNSDNWWNGDNASRYDYLYTDDELDEWLDRINMMSKNTRILVLVFNNHWRGKAVQNAIKLGDMLKKRTDRLSQAEMFFSFALAANSF